MPNLKTLNDMLCFYGHSHRKIIDRELRQEAINDIKKLEPIFDGHFCLVCLNDECKNENHTSSWLREFICGDEHSDNITAVINYIMRKFNLTEGDLK